MLLRALRVWEADKAIFWVPEDSLSYFDSWTGECLLEVPMFWLEELFRFKTVFLGREDVVCFTRRVGLAMGRSGVQDA